MAQKELGSQVRAHDASFGTVRDVGVDRVDRFVGEDAGKSARQRMDLPSVVEHLAIDGVADGELPHRRSSTHGPRRPSMAALEPRLGSPWLEEK